MKLFTLENCPPCEQLKNFLKHNNIFDKFEILHIFRDDTKNSEEDLELIKKYGIRSFPAMVIDEKLVEHNKFSETVNKLAKDARSTVEKKETE